MYIALHSYSEACVDPDMSHSDIPPLPTWDEIKVLPVSITWEGLIRIIGRPCRHAKTWLTDPLDRVEVCSVTWISGEKWLMIE